jgi:glutamyl-tRNA synthetase
MIRTRFAPSPTGSLHVGGARTALYCLLYARRHAGRFLLRIEDTDRARSTDEAAEGILRDLTWLGLAWDEGPGREQAGTGPYFQSRRLHRYAEVFDDLLASGHAYEAWDTPAELDALRLAAEGTKQGFRYRERAWTADEVAAFRAAGRVPVLRLRAPAHDITVDDAILGPVTVAADELEDIVIRKADGFPTFHFAVVCDDHDMGVSLVLRGQEHLLNTPKHLGLYEALAWTPPSHAHLPLILNPSGSKMSKRDKAKAAREAAREADTLRAARGESPGWSWLAEAAGRPETEIRRFVAREHDSVSTAEAIAAVLHVELPLIEVMDFRKAGYLPEGLLNYLALLGWSPGGDRELFTFDELVERFDLEGVNTTSARFDFAKVRAINGEHVRRATLDRLLDVQDSYLEVVPGSPFHHVPRPRRRAFLALYQARFETLADLDRATRFFFERPTRWEAAAVEKHLVKPGALPLLPEIAEALRRVATWEAGPLQAAVEALATARGLGIGKVAQPIRVAVTGTAVSPGIGETLELLGRDETVARIAACHAALA